MKDKAGDVVMEGESKVMEGGRKLMGRESRQANCHCRRVMPRTLGGTLSAVLLVLMPKCPICLAAYVSAATGVGIGLTTARYFRTGLIVICVALLVWVSAPLWRRWLPLSRRWFGHHN